MSRWAALLVLAGNLLLAGCASTMAGLDSTPKYGCKAPTGAQCTSVSGVYANSLQRPMMGANLLASKPGTESTATKPVPPAMLAEPAAPAASPLRSPSRVLSLWIAPWEDSDGDLNEASLVHVLVDPGTWLIERIRPKAPRPREAIAPGKPAALPTKDGANS